MTQERADEIVRKVIYASREDAVVAHDACRQIAKGTILPDNHGRLIDADVLMDGYEDNYEFCEAVNATPTIIKSN